MRFHTLSIGLLSLTCCTWWLPAVAAEEPAAEPTVEPGAAIVRAGAPVEFPTAVAALSAAQDGEVVVLHPGTHRGPLVLERPGLTLRGESGARVDAADVTWQPAWTPEPAYGATAYSAPLAFEPATMRCDERVMIDAREARGGLALHALGVGRAGRAALGPLFTWRKEPGRVVVSFADADPAVAVPAAHRLLVSRAGAVAITVRGMGCTVSGLIVTGGADGIQLSGTANSTVRGCLVYGCDVGIRIGQGSSACHVVGNDVTLHAAALNANCDLESGTAGDDVWSAHKNFGTYDKTGILADRSGPDNEIAGNYLYDVWDGIETGNGVGKEGIRRHYEIDIPQGTGIVNRGLQVHHNRVDLAMDDALSPGNDQFEQRWYSNLVTRARCAVRFHTPDRGPFRFFDNTLVDNGDGLRLYKSAPASATVLIHNNLIIHPDGVIYHKMEDVAWDDPWLAAHLPRGTPGFHLYNNLFVSERQFTNQGGDVAPNFTAERNLFTCTRSALPALQARDRTSLFGVVPHFADAAAGDWRLVSDSPGYAAGLPFAAFGLAASLPAGWAAPATPDIGLLRIDPAATPHGPVSGLWQIADTLSSMAERRVEEVHLPAERWIQCGSATLAVSLPAGMAVDHLILLRAANRDLGKWTVAATAADGSDCGSAAGGPPGMQAIRVPLHGVAGGATLTLRINDQADARWRLALEPGMRVGFQTEPQLAIAKFDGGTYDFDYAVPAGLTEFTARLQRGFDGVCTLSVVRPDGSSEAVPENGVIATHAQTGIYRLRAVFTKRARISVAPAQTLWQSAEQEAAPLRSRWPRPAY